MRLDCSGKDRALVYSADTFAGADQDADKAVLAPIGAPGVLDEPVLLAGPFVRAIANE